MRHCYWMLIIFVFAITAFARQRDRAGADSTGWFYSSDSLRASRYWHEQGQTLEAQCNFTLWAQVIACYRRALDLNPHNGASGASLVGLLVHMDNCTAALGLADSLLRRAPKEALLWAAQARALKNCRTASRDSVSACYERALALDPHLGELWAEAGVWLSSGEAADSSNHDDRALHCFQQGLKYAPKNADLWAKSGYRLASLGRPREAMHAFRQAMRLDSSQHDWLLRVLISTSRDLRDTAATCSLYRDAQRTNPNELWVWYECGEFLCGHGQAVAGLADIEHAIALDSTYYNARLTKATALESLGRTDEAIHAWDAVIALAHGGPPSTVVLFTGKTVLARGRSR